MRLFGNYTIHHWLRTLRILGVASVLCLFLVPASYGQNTKGDKPQGGTPTKRETRFKSSQKKKVRGKKSYNRVQARRSTRANRAQPSRPAKIYSQKNQFVNNSSRTAKDARRNLRSSNSQRVSGRSSSSQTRNVYPQRGPFVNNPSRTPQSKPNVVSNKSTVRRVNTRSKSIGSKNVYKQSGPFVHNPSRVPNDKPRLTKNYSPGYKRVKSPPKDSQQRWSAKTTRAGGVRSATGRTKNVFSQKGPFVHNPSIKASKRSGISSNRSQVARLKTTGSPAGKPGKGKRIRNSSVSRPYISRRSINAFAGFWNKKSKGERPWVKGDLAGHKLRGKNFATKFPVRINPTAHPYTPKKSVGDQPYQGRTTGGYKSATRPGRAWKGDIAGRKIRARNYSSKKTTTAGQPIFPPKKSKIKNGDTPYRGRIPGGGYRSVSQQGKKKFISPLPGKAPGGVANKIDSYSGNIRGKKGKPSAAGALYSGNLKSRRAAKGGGSVSGSLWNNNGRSLDGTPPLRRNIGYALFSGNKKTRVQPKGGGSVSGSLWNNNNRPLVGRTPSSTSVQMGRFQGNIKATKSNPSKEIGGVPKQLRVTKPKMRDQGEEYTGRLKSHRPLKGGGSVSGKLWNNKETPLSGRAPRGQLGIDSYKGNVKVTNKNPSKAVGGFSPRKFFERKPAMKDQGEEFTGFLKAQKPGQQPKGQSTLEKYQGNIRFAKKEPSKEVGGTAPKKYVDRKPVMHDQGEEFTGFIKYRFKKVYDDKPHAADGSLKGIAASKSSIKASEYSKVLKLKYDYVRNPSSSKEAQKTREPGKAFASEGDYQGNIKMKKFELFGKKNLHPDAKFVKTNKNNVDSERGLLTNIKLVWAKWFGKDNLQPSSVKQKEKKPGYDKGEKGLWYDKHNSSGDNSRRREKAAEGQ